jgi:predicted TIM-barrel fold metal-dependent hydrolase
VKIFDIHPHVVSHDHARYPFSNVFDHVAPYVTERPIDTDQMLAEMDAAGVAKSALVHASTAYGYDCSYVADSAAAHPGRFASVCSIDVRAADAPERLRYWIVERKMNGLRIFTAGGTMAENSDWLVDAETFPAWETATELGIPVCLQMKAGGFRILPKLLERFPNVRIILDHVSHPKASDGPPFHAADPLWALKGAKNVYLKISTTNFPEWNEGASTTEAFLGKCIDTFGIDRIAWGSNYPASVGPLSALVELAKRELAFLSERDREQIFSGTAQALYPTLA